MLVIVRESAVVFPPAESVPPKDAELPLNDPMVLAPETLSVSNVAAVTVAG